MPTTAMTLMMANQNSNSPNALTPMRLTAVMASSTTAAVAHAGTDGNQYWMYVPTTVSSAIATAT